MKDELIVCSNCNQEFVWTTGEQQFFADKKLSSPTKCMICRSIVKEADKDEFRGRSRFGKKKLDERG